MERASGRRRCGAAAGQSRSAPGRARSERRSTPGHRAGRPGGRRGRGASCGRRGIYSFLAFRDPGTCGVPRPMGNARRALDGLFFPGRPVTLTTPSARQRTIICARRASGARWGGRTRRERVRKADRDPWGFSKTAEPGPTGHLGVLRAASSKRPRDLRGRTRRSHSVRGAKGIRWCAQEDSNPQPFDP